MRSLERPSFVEGVPVVSRKNRTAMCFQCRHDKQRCDPVDRNWDELQQKCGRCSKLGYDCGPSERAQRRSRKTSPTISTTEIHHAEKSLSWTISYDDLFPWSPRHLTTSPSSDSLAFQGMEADVHTVRDHSTSYDPTGFRSSDSLAKLGDQNATRELLRWDLCVCDQAEKWLGSSDHNCKLRAAIHGVICAIQEDFEQCIKSTCCIVASGMDSAKEKTMLELYLIAYKFANPPSTTIVAQSSGEHGTNLLQESSFQDMVHTLRQSTFTHSDADFICGNIWNSTQYVYPASTGPETGVMGSYQNASAAIRRVLSETVLRKVEHRELLFGSSTGVDPDTDTVSGYPPFHLAVMHGPLPVIVKLLRDSTLQMWELDCLQRTPIHVAAYAGRIHELQCIFDYDILAAVNAGQDIFGLTPLMVAACKDDVKACTLLLRHGADHTVKDLLGRNVLALAARNGSQGAVKLLLRHGNIPPSSNLDLGELCEAIRHERGDIVDLLIGHYNRSKIINDFDLLQISAGIITARQKGFSEVADALENVESYQSRLIGATACYHQFGSYDPESDCPPAHAFNYEKSSSLMGGTTVASDTPLAQSGTTSMGRQGLVCKPPIARRRSHDRSDHRLLTKDWTSSSPAIARMPLANTQYSAADASGWDSNLGNTMLLYHNWASRSSTRRSSTRPSSTVPWS